MLSHDAPILLVDDSVPAQQMLQQTLNSAGYSNIHVASTGKEALEHIKAATESSRLYKIIFLDWKMPEMDGLEFLKICRNDLNLKDVAIIMLTGVSDQKSLILAMGSGATSFMTKPVTAEAVLKKVEQVGNWIEAQGRDS